MSTELEEQLRAGLKAAARQVRPDILRGLPEPGTARSRRRRTVRWLAPALAVLAVATVLGGVRLAARPAADARPASPSPAVTAAGPVPASTTAGPPGPAGPPPFYVTDTGGADHLPGSVATIRASVTGAVLGHVTAPAGQAFIRITAAASDRRFVLASSDFVGRIVNTSLWLLTLAPDGHPAQFRRLHTFISDGLRPNRFNQPQDVTGMALSPDGTLLAVSVSLVFGPPPSRIELISVNADRVLRTWSASGFVVDGLSWPQGDRFLFYNRNPPLGTFSQASLLNVSSPGGSLAAHSTALPIRASAIAGLAVVPANGDAALLAWTQVSHPSNQVKSFGDWILAEYSTSTGRLLRTLARLDDGNEPTVLAVDPSGQHLLIGGAGRLVRPDQPSPPGPGPGPDTATVSELARVDNGQLTLLPAQGSLDPLAAAW